MAYRRLHYQNARFKASHNSYQRNEDFHQQLTFDASQPFQAGCRGLECDIWRHSDSTKGTSVGYFMIGHESSGPHAFADYLGYLLSWHEKDLNHDPILVMIDIKSTAGDYTVFPSEIDAYLGEWFNKDLIFKPSDLSRTLGEIVHQELNWPTIEDLSGKFMFFFTGNDTWKLFYANHLTPNSLCFSSFNLDQDDPLTGNQPPLNCPMINISLASNDFKKWSILVQKLRQRGFIIRGYTLNDATTWNDALTAPVNMVTTDEVEHKTWAMVGSEPFVAI